VNSAQPLRLALSPSYRFAMLIVLIHALAAATFLTVMTAWAGGALAVLVLALGLAAAWDRALFRAKAAPAAIEILPTGEARCLFANGESAAIALTAGRGVTRYWVALRLQAPRRRALLATAGMLDAESFRRLRLWALWGRLPGVVRRQRPA
jgi:hypothetical protein